MCAKHVTIFIKIKSHNCVLLSLNCKISLNEYSVVAISCNIVNVTNETFHQEVINSSKPVLLDFWASWCGPCRMVGPILEEIANERTDIKVCKVNVDEQPELASRFRIVSIPTLMVIKDGQITNQSMGARPKAQILKML